MKKELLVTSLSRAAWADFAQEWKSWVLLAAGGIVLMILSISAQFYIPEYRHFAALFLCIPGAIFTAMLHQNGLDAAYGRKLSMFSITPSILFASLFFIAISLYNPFPEYLEFLLLVFPEDFQFLLAINWIIHILISYLLVRCMFVGMIILEEKCNVLEAFRKSFRLTAHHLFLLLGIFIYLAIALALSALTIVGYFIVLPYTILMKSLLFKKLNEIYLHKLI
jgi:hypothetical protein